MSVISRLKVWLTADTKEFSDRLKKANKDVDGFSGGIGKIGGLISKAFAALGVIELGKRLVTFGRQVDDTTNKVEQLTGIRDMKLAGEIKATADVFQKDYISVLKTANTLQKQLGITSEEAMEIITRGLSSGLDLNGDFLEQLTEYAPQFKEAGVSAKGMLSILQQSIKDGVFSDKGMDAIKEATIRIREMTPATRDALNGIGLVAGDIQKGLANGSLTIFGVIQKVSEKLNELPASSAKVGTAIADIFGGPGEDAGLKYLQTLKNINTGHEVVATGIGKDQEELTKSLARLNEAAATIFDGIGESFIKLRTILNNGLADAMETVSEKDISWIDKYILSFLPGVSKHNQYIKEKNKLQKRTNSEIIAELKLHEKELFELHCIEQQYLKINTNQQGYFSQTLAAIRKEKELRESGKKVEKLTPVPHDEINMLEKVKAMTENTIPAINDKIKVYQDMRNAVELTDTASAIAYTREIYRLETLIAKNKELVNSKLRQEVNVEPIKAQPSLGIGGALLDNSGNMSQFEDLIKLPEYLNPSTEELKNISVEMIDISNEIGGAFASMAMGIGESVGMLIAGGGDLKNFANTVAASFADMAIQVGQIAIGFGVTKVLIEKALSNPLTGGVAAIAAGTALVALGTAVKSALGNVAGGGGTFSTNAYSNNLDVRTKNNALDRVSQSINVEVTGEFRVQGNTLVAAINKENRRKNLTT